MIASTMGFSHYLHSWCLCHVSGFAEISKARAAHFLRNRVFHELYKMMLSEWKKTHMHALFWTKFLSKGQMEQVPPKLVPHTGPAWATGLFWAVQGCSHPLGHMFLMGEVLACGSQNRFHSKNEDCHTALQPCCFSQAGRSSAMLLQRVLSQACWLYPTPLPGLAKWQRPVLPHKIDLGQDLHHIKRKTNRMSSLV